MKDPAFLFYPSDFLTGTIFFSHEDLGLFIKLLCVQHQHECRINKHDFNQLCNEKHLKVRQKFKEDERGFYNERLQLEIAKRSKDADSSRKNGLKGGRPKTDDKPKHNLNITQKKPKHNLTVNENINVIESKKGTEIEKKILEFYEFRKQIKKKIVEASKPAFLKRLKELSAGDENIAVEILEQSIANSWQGIFELKNNQHGKTNAITKNKHELEQERKSSIENLGNFARAALQNASNNPTITSISE